MNAWRKISVAVVILLIIADGQAQEGALTPEILAGCVKVAASDANLLTRQNAVSNNDIKNIALNRQMLGTLDHYFAHRLSVPAITDQKSSGRCWLFTALNVIRPRVMQKYGMKNFEFSENYLFFYDQLEKANLFLEAIIQTRTRDIDDREVQWLFQHPLQDGGVWTMMPGLIQKYGIVPKEVMPESYHSENTALMSRLLQRKLREHGLRLRQAHNAGKDLIYLRTKKAEQLTEIYRILVVTLGTPPQEFSWRYLDKNDSLIVKGRYTPQRFYQEILNVNLNDYVMLMDDPSKDYYQHYEIEYDRNCWDGPNWTFINVPVAEIKIFAKASLLANEPMYFSCDVGKFLEREKGYLAVNIYDYEALFGVPFTMNKKERILSYESSSSHGMALIGLDTTANGIPAKWLLENSWGKDDGNEGFLTMTDEWFGEYMFRLVILKQFLPEKVLAVRKQKPVKLPPWDRMF